MKILVLNGSPRPNGATAAMTEAFAQGARQAGKTWLMKEFGQKVYQDYIYINFDSNSRMSELFSSDLNPQRLILGLELYSGKKTFPRTPSSFSMKSGRFQEPFPA